MHTRTVFWRSLVVPFEIFKHLFYCHEYIALHGLAVGAWLASCVKLLK